MFIRAALALLSICGPFSSGELRAAEPEGPGELVICLASKGQFAHGQPADCEGLRGLAELAHRYGFPVTYYLKPFAVAASRADLRDWNRLYGDEVGWFSEGTEFGSAEEELASLRELVDWAPVESTGNTKYGPQWVDLYRRAGIASAWGRCYEQTFVDGITDRGCPPGFYYAMRDCYKAPNPEGSGLISVPWLSNDLNLCFRTAWQPTFTFDPNDTEALGVSTPEDATFWEAELDQYQAQVRLNRVVPLVIQQELSEFSALNSWKRNGAAILENLFKVIKRRGVRVMACDYAFHLDEGLRGRGAPELADLHPSDVHALVYIRQFDTRGNETWKMFKDRIATDRQEQVDLLNPALPIWISKTDDKPNPWLNATDDQPIPDVARNAITRAFTRMVHRHYGHLLSYDDDINAIKTSTGRA